MARSGGNLTWGSSRAWREEKGIWDTVLELGEHSVMILTWSLEKASRRKSSFGTHCLANYLNISGSADGSQAECLYFKRLCREVAAGMVQDSAGFPTFETVFQPSVLNSESSCEFGKYCFLFHAFCRVLLLLRTPLGFIFRWGILFFSKFR